jgi:hypothetical protein
MRTAQNSEIDIRDCFFFFLDFLFDGLSSVALLPFGCIDASSPPRSVYASLADG